MRLLLMYSPGCPHCVRLLRDMDAALEPGLRRALPRARFEGVERVDVGGPRGPALRARLPPFRTVPQLFFVDGPRAAPRVLRHLRESDRNLRALLRAAREVGPQT